jgi:MFS superfamily sulfate permease-like transporter
MSTAETIRSNVERDAADLQVLDQFGGRIAILVVRGFLFFGNGKRLVDFVDALLDDHDEPQYVVRIKRSAATLTLPKRNVFHDSSITPVKEATFRGITITAGPRLRTRHRRRLVCHRRVD